MYSQDRTTRGGGRFERETPSFSSSLLNEIYHSIDEELGVDRPRERSLDVYSVSRRKQSKSGLKAGDVADLVRRGRGLDRDDVFFSPTLSCSDSCSSGFSSSDTESVYSATKYRTPCLAPPRLKTARESVSSWSDKTGVETEFALLHEQRKRPGLGGDEGIVKSKSRALSFYSNLKKAKHPISPGGKLASFINSIFAANANVRKPKLSVTPPIVKSGDSSACSSASSFSRSCLSKYSPKTREKLRDGAKRTVQFYPVSVILDENSRPCGQKPLSPPKYDDYEKENARQKRIEETRHKQQIERSSRVEEAAIEFLRNYRRYRNKTEKTANVPATTLQSGNDRTSDDDAASSTSSDLFELDHLAVLGDDGMYCQELPVYETTHVSTNCAIASGLIL